MNYNGSFYETTTPYRSGFCETLANRYENNFKIRSPSDDTNYLINNLDNVGHVLKI